MPSADCDLVIFTVQLFNCVHAHTPGKNSFYLLSAFYSAYIYFVALLLHVYLVQSWFNLAPRKLKNVHINKTISFPG